MGDKSVETLGSKIRFFGVSVTFSPLPPKNVDFFYFFDCTDYSAYTTLNWGAGGIRELTLDANKIEQMLRYRKASFPEKCLNYFCRSFSGGYFCKLYRFLLYIQALASLFLQKRLNA